MQVVYSSNIMFSSFVTISERQADAQAVREQEERVHMIKVSPTQPRPCMLSFSACSIPGRQQLKLGHMLKSWAAAMEVATKHQAQDWRCARPSCHWHSLVAGGHTCRRLAGT